MQSAIKREIKRLADRAMARAARSEKIDTEYKDRFSKRTGVVAGVSSKPAAPYPNRHFDPIYCKRNANFLAKTVWYKVLNRTYVPKPALQFLIDKPDGGKRPIMAFSFPDAALANVLMRRLRERNIKRFSPHSFAYHPDKNIFDAILDLRGFVVSSYKTYSVQIDFSSYFESIPSTYIEKLLGNRDLFSLTEEESAAIKEFMYHRYAQRKQYAAGQFLTRRRGTPQGSSISLILANLANHSLDVRLEKMPGKFVRFADDVTALCNDYKSAVEIEGCFYQHCAETGIEINQRKSPGVAILATKPAEIRTFPKIDYLGYRFVESGLTLSDKTLYRIKEKLSKLIDVYLVYYPDRVGFSSARVGSDYDWDLLGLISEIRNYLYGGLGESEIRAMLDSGRKLRKVRGLMSFYALLDDQEPLRHLDGWLVNSLRRALRKRNTILSSKYGVAGLLPSNKDLIVGTWINPDAWDGPNKPEFGLPSFRRGWRAARKYYFTFGLKDVLPPKYSYQYIFG